MAGKENTTGNRDTGVNSNLMIQLRHSLNYLCGFTAKKFLIRFEQSMIYTDDNH